jgi:hypothetical protein
MADTQHTPTPWSIGGLSSNPGEGHVIESDSADRTIAWTANSYCTANDEEYISQEDEANAEFIVRACNSHDALLRAIQEVLYSYEDDSDTDLAIKLESPMENLQEAIAKAKGGA